MRLLLEFGKFHSKPLLQVFPQVHHPVDQPEQLSHLICIISCPVQVAYQLPLGTKTTFRIPDGPQRLDLGTGHLNRQRRVVLPFPLQLVDQLADRKLQTGFEIRDLEQIFTRSPLGFQIGQDHDGHDPPVKRPKQPAVELGDPALEPGFGRRLDFQMQQNPLGLAGLQPHLHQQIHSLIAAAGLSENLADLLVVPFNRAPPVNRGVHGREVLGEELG